MTAFTQIPSLVTFVPLNTALSGDVNSNFAAIRNQFNNLVPSQNTLAVDTLTENTASAGVTVNKKFIISGPSLLVSGTTVSGIATFSSGFAISGGVVSGVMTLSSGLAISGGVVSGVATFSSGWAISGGVVSGVVTFSSGIGLTAGALNATGLAATVGSLTVSGILSAVGQIQAGVATLTAPPISFAAQTDTGLYALLNASGTNTLDIIAGGTNLLSLSPGPTRPSVFVAGVANMQIGNVTLATGATLGYIVVPTVATTMTGVPNFGGAGVALCYDTTNNHLLAYNGGWKSVTLA